MLYLWFSVLVAVILYLTCFDLNPFLFRTLAQRAAKRAKAPVIVIEDDPTMSAGGVSETTLTMPPREEFPVRERSPARENSPARDSTVDPMVTETATVDLGAGNSFVRKLSLGFFFF